MLLNLCCNSNWRAVHSHDCFTCDIYRPCSINKGFPALHFTKTLAYSSKESLIHYLRNKRVKISLGKEHLAGIAVEMGLKREENCGTSWPQQTYLYPSAWLSAFLVTFHGAFLACGFFAFLLKLRKKGGGGGEGVVCWFLFICYC